MLFPRLAAAALLLASPALAAPWHHPLSAGRGEPWTKRIAVTLENLADSPAEGSLAEVSVPALAGQPVSQLRVCDEAGHELLFDVRELSGASRRLGVIAAEDRIIVPVECGPRGKATLFLYFGNESAFDAGEYLPGWFTNGDFEADAPGASAGTHQRQTAAGAWQPAETDATHRATIDPKAGRSGSACAKVEVNPAAELKWTKWHQDELRIEPGRRYRVSGWVRAQEVNGAAGWFLHVNGEQPRILNRSLDTGGGTYDWKHVAFEFTAPPGARTATFGTLLRGTGTVWYDDAEFVALDVVERWKITPGVVEKLQLSLTPPQPGGIQSKGAASRGVARVRVLNVTEAEASGVVSVDLRPIRARLRELPLETLIRVTATDAPGESLASARSGDTLLFPAQIAPRSTREFSLAFTSERETAENAAAALRRLTQSSANLAPNITFETDGQRVRDWQLNGEGRTIEPGHTGARALEVKIPPRDQPWWNGWRSKRIPVEPSATYLFTAYVQAQGLVGRGHLYAHVQDAAGKLTPSRGQAHSAGSVTGDTPWTPLSLVVDTAPEARTAELHLTTNGTAGTLRHDGVFFARALSANLVMVESERTFGKDIGPRVWQVNPLVKVFPDSPPGPALESVQIECARNEYEPFELVLSVPSESEAEIQVSPLRDAFGNQLPQVHCESVGYVPIDHPSAYYRFDGPTWHRPVPNTQGATDGWVDDWPDPLIPVSRPLKLQRGKAQPVWLTVHAPSAAVPGEYRATISIKLGEQKLEYPLSVRVHPFQLPNQRNLKVIFDWRWGRGGDFGMARPELKSKWLELLRDHRLGIDEIDPPPLFTYHAGKVRMDATAFDDAARLCFDRYGLNVCYLPMFFYSFGWAYPAREIFGLKPFTPEFNSAFKQAYKLLSDHLREKGWHDRFVFYISDEPHFGEPHVVEQMMKLCALAHEVDPTIPIYSSTWTHFPKWDGSLDIWGAGHHGIFSVEEMRDLQKRGKKIWFTCDGQMAIDTPLLATERMLPWYCHKYGAEGFEFWGLSWWTLDPWTHGWHSFISQSSDGKAYYSTRYPNGDGYLTYPGTPVGVDGPISSIRLAQLREGIEDYEAFRLLTQLIAEARAAGRNVKLAEHALAAAHDLVSIPNSSGLRTTENLPEPDKLPAARKLVNAAIVSLQK